MIRLCFLIRSLNLGGSERQLIELVTHLNPSVFDITVLTFYSQGELVSDLKKYSHIRVQSLNKRGRWDFFFFTARFLASIYKLRPDVLHGYLGSANLMALIAKLILPRIAIIWGVRTSKTNFSRFGLFEHSIWKMECLLPGCADRIIFNSESGRLHAIQHGFPKNKCTTIFNGIDTKKFDINTESGKSVRLGWGISEEEILIGMVARLDPLKDHATFIKALSLLKPGKLKFKAVFVGDGPDQIRDNLAHFARSLHVDDKIVWAGRRNDTPSVYNALDILCSSSVTEGFSNCIGEAMACGIPCVVTKVGDSERIIGDTGIGVSAEDPHSLALALKTMMESCRGVGGACRQRVLQNFTIAQLVKETTREIEALHPSQITRPTRHPKPQTI